jgi:hypothetical protein
VSERGEEMNEDQNITSFRMALQTLWDLNKTPPNECDDTFWGIHDRQVDVIFDTKAKLEDRFDYATVQRIIAEEKAKRHEQHTEAK